MSRPLKPNDVPGMIGRIYNTVEALRAAASGPEGFELHEALYHLKTARRHVRDAAKLRQPLKDEPLDLSDDPVAVATFERYQASLQAAGINRQAVADINALHPRDRKTLVCREWVSEMQVDNMRRIKRRGKDD